MVCQVTLLRTITALTLEPLGNATPKELWELAVQSGKLVRDEIEMLGSSQAGMVCHTCLEPLEMRLHPITVTLKQGQVAFGKISHMDLYCSADATHKIVEDNYAAAKDILENIGA